VRETYDTTDETRAVLSDHVKGIADEMDKSVQHFYNILSNTERDWFAGFKPMYAAAIRAGAPAHHWDNALAAIRERYAAKRAARTTATDALLHKIETDADTTGELIRALKDGRISLREAARLMVMIKRERDVLDEVERAILALKED